MYSVFTIQYTCHLGDLKVYSKSYKLKRSRWKCNLCITVSLGLETSYICFSCHTITPVAVYYNTGQYFLLFGYSLGSQTQLGISRNLNLFKKYILMIKFCIQQIWNNFDFFYKIFFFFTVFYFFVTFLHFFSSIVDTVGFYGNPTGTQTTVVIHFLVQ